MKAFLLSLLILSFSLSAEPVEVSMDLGTKIQGDLELTHFKVKTEFGDLSLPIKKVVSIQKSGKKFQFLLSDKTRVFGKLDREELSLTTVLGKLSIDLKRMKTLTVSANKELADTLDWIKHRNGLGLRILYSNLIKAEGEFLFVLNAEVKNFTKRTIKYPSPYVNYYDHHMDSYGEGCLFTIDFLDENGKMREFENQAMMESIQRAYEEDELGPGQSFKVRINVKITKEYSEEELLEEEVAVNEVQILNSTTVLPDGKYNVRLSMHNYFSNKVEIISPVSPFKLWYGTMRSELIPISIKW